MIREHDYGTPAVTSPDKVTLTIDGRDTRELSLETLRAQISVVSQEAFLFNGTVRENIDYGSAAPGSGDAQGAARAASVDHLVRSLPKGYDTILSPQEIADLVAFLARAK